MLVKTNKYNQLYIDKNIYKNKLITKALVIKSLMNYKNLIMKYYPHDIPNKWFNYFRYINKLKIDYLSYNRFILRLQSLLNDSHCFTNGRLEYIFNGGFRLDIINNKIVVIGSNNPNIPKGAVILKIDNIRYNKYIRPFISLCPGHNNFIKKYNALYYFVENSNKKIKKFTYFFNNKIITKYVKFGHYKPFTDSYNFFEIYNKTLVINPSAPYKDVKKYISKCNTIIFDMRQYPKNFDKLYKLIEYLNIFNKPIHFINYYNANIDGSYTKVKLYINPSNEIITNYPKIIIYVDHKTLSASEHLTVALQSLRKYTYVKTIGTPTGGANGDVVSIPMLYGINANVNFNYTEYPDNTKIQRKGVKYINQSTKALH
jgi:hypothetical protein